MEKLIQLALNEDWDIIIKQLRQESPIVADDFMHAFFQTKKDAYYPYEKWTKEQAEAFCELGSADYRTAYYIKKGEENLSQREW